MDTDDLSEMAWSIIVRAAQVSDTLRVELGALCHQHENEDDWLRGVLKLLQEITEDTEEYVEYWNLEEEERVSATALQDLAVELSRQAYESLAIPVARRD